MFISRYFEMINPTTLYGKLVALVKGALHNSRTAVRHPLPQALNSPAALRTFLGMTGTELADLPAEVQMGSVWTYSAAIGLNDLPTLSDKLIIGSTTAANLKEISILHPYAASKVSHGKDFNTFRANLPVLVAVVGDVVARGVWAAAVGDVLYRGENLPPITA